jgi:hypothetical protein
VSGSARGVGVFLLIASQACNQEAPPQCSVGIAVTSGAAVPVTSTSTTMSAVSTTVSATDASTSLTTVNDGGVTETSAMLMNTASGEASTITTTSTIPTPTPVLVPLQVIATFTCPLEGIAHASLVTSAGQFTSGLAPSGGGGGGDAGASAGSAGVAGASVTVALAANDAGQASSAGDTVLYGYVTLQLTIPTTAQVETVVSDQSTCTTIAVGPDADGQANAYQADASPGCAF